MRLKSFARRCHVFSGTLVEGTQTSANPPSRKAAQSSVLVIHLVSTLHRSKPIETMCAPPFFCYSICFSRFVVTISHNNMDENANAKICETKFPTTQLWHGDLLDFLDLFDVLWLDWDLSRDSNVQSFTVFQRFWCVSIKTVAGSNKNRWGALRCCHFFIVSQFQPRGSEYLSTWVLHFQCTWNPLFPIEKTNGGDAFVSFKRIKKREVLCIFKVSLTFCLKKLQLDVATDLTKRQSFWLRRRAKKMRPSESPWCRTLANSTAGSWDKWWNGYENDCFRSFFGVGKLTNHWTAVFCCGMALKLVQLQELLGKEHGCFDGSICGPEFAAIEANCIFVGNR